MNDNSQPSEVPSPTVTLVDLQNALQIIDIAAERGAFRGGELTSVGSVRDKFEAFLRAATPAAAESEDVADAPEKAE